MKTNQLPEININLKIFGDLSPTTNLRKATAFADNDNLNLGQDSIFFNFLNKNSAIDDFSFSANFQIEPTYEIESVKSSKVKILPPVSYSTSASIEMTEQEYEDVTGLLQNENYDRQVSLSFVDLQAVENVQTIEQEYLSFTGSGLETGIYNLEFDTGFANLDTFSFSEFGLSSQNISITPRDTIKLNVSYDGYDLSLPTGSASSVSSFEHPSSVVSGIQSQVDSAIQHFKDSFFDIPKITGEDFENTVEERLLLENESFLLLEDGDRFIGNFVYSEYALTGAEYSDSGYIFNFNTGVFVQKEDFESFATGQTNQNLHFLAIDGFTIQNFETEITGQFNNQIHDLNPLIFEQDFETELQGTTFKNIYNLNEAMQIESFEAEALGLTNKNLYYLEWFFPSGSSSPITSGNWQEESIEYFDINSTPSGVEKTFITNTSLEDSFVDNFNPTLINIIESDGSSSQKYFLTKNVGGATSENIPFGFQEETINYVNNSQFIEKIFLTKQ